MTTPQTIGERIRHYRMLKAAANHKIACRHLGTGGANIPVESFFTQEMLAKAAGVTQSQVSAWERGKNEPRFSTLMKLTKVLDVVVAGGLIEE